MKNRILLIILALLFISPLANASHLASGRIQWECLAPHQYRITLVIYRDCSGIPQSSTTESVRYRNVNNPNVPQGTITCYRTPGSGARVPDECNVDLTPTTCQGGRRYGIESYEYEGIFDLSALGAPTPFSLLPDSEQEWLLYWEVCCRNPNNNVQANSMYVDGLLINKARFNNCNNTANPKYIYIPGYCLGEPAKITFEYEDPDKDSVAFELVQALDFGGNPLGYIAPYTPAAPLPTIPQSPAGIFLDAVGNIYFTPDPTRLVGPYVIVVKSSEYRGGQLIGWTKLDIQVVLELNNTYCDNRTPSYRKDTVELSCGATEVEFELDTKIDCASASPDASEFRLFYQDGNGLPLDSLYTFNCDIENRSNELKVTFFQPLYKNGIYYLYSKKGRDQDTFGQKCKKYMEEYDTLVIEIKDCYSYNKPLSMINVSVDSTTNADLTATWKKPTDFKFEYFDKYIVYHAPDNVSWVKFAEVTDSNTTTAYDGDPMVQPIQGKNYYAVVMQLSGSGETTELSKDLNSIHLFNDPVYDPDSEQISVKWNSYPGWKTSYFVQMKPSGSSTWSLVGNVTDTTITVPTPPASGTYNIRVYTNDDATYPEDYRAYSNWIPFDVPVRDINIPNVFTPNDDNRNDRFIIENIKYYPNTQVVIYNRWGETVFESNNYNDDNAWDGKNVTSGTYYYMVKITTEDKPRNGALRVILSE